MVFSPEFSLKLFTWQQTRKTDWGGNSSSGRVTLWVTPATGDMVCLRGPMVTTLTLTWSSHSQCWGFSYKEAAVITLLCWCNVGERNGTEALLVDKAKCSVVTLMRMLVPQQHAGAVASPIHRFSQTRTRGQGRPWRHSCDHHCSFHLYLTLLHIPSLNYQPKMIDNFQNDV